MSHIHPHEWERYVTDQLDDDMRQAYEDHLYECDLCLEQYLLAIEQHRDRLPVPQEKERTEELIHSVLFRSTDTDKKRGRYRRPFYQQSLFHYFIAAILTIVLMTSGLFAQLTQLTSQFTTKSEQEETISLTEQLIEKRITVTNKEAKAK